MGARHFKELVAWQLSNQLKLEIYRMTDRPGVKRDWQFCRRIRKSSSGVPSNIAEGFGRHSHREFARFVEISRGSLLETGNHLGDACDRRHIDDKELAPLLVLWGKALKAVSGLLRYLQESPEPVNWR